MAVGLFACQPELPPRVTQIPFVADSGHLAIRCGILIDGLADAPQYDRLVIIREGRFDRITAGGFKPGRDLPLLDLSEHTCLPGLINTHTHLDYLPENANDLSVYYRRTTAETTAIAEQNARENLLTGFTTIRNVGAYFPDVIYDVRDRINAGEIVGPRVRTAGPYLTIPGGGGDLVIPGHDESEIPSAARTGVARGADEFRQKAELAIVGGADVLKVIASGAVFAFGGTPGAPEMTQEEIAAVVDVAHAAGIRVTAHVHSAQSGKDAILAGVDSIEHASFLDDEAIALALEHGVAFSMDIYNGTYTEDVGREQGYPEEFMRKNFETTETQRVVFEKAHVLGIPILFGTDAGVLPHAMGAWQFEIMVERGMTPLAAIKSATSVPAIHMGLQDDIGAIAVGRLGDLIAVRVNPLDDISNLKNIAVVIKGGIIHRYKMDEALE